MAAITPKGRHHAKVVMARTWPDGKDKGNEDIRMEDSLVTLVVVNSNSSSLTQIDTSYSSLNWIVFTSLYKPSALSSLRHKSVRLYTVSPPLTRTRTEKYRIPV